MTRRVFVEVPIETVEQAEALPRDAILFDGDPEDGDTYSRFGDEWRIRSHPGTLSLAIEFGWQVTALVPVDAEEEWGIRRKRGDFPMGAHEEAIDVADEWERSTDERPALITRIVTSWEPTP